MDLLKKKKIIKISHFQALIGYDQENGKQHWRMEGINSGGKGKNTVIFTPCYL